MQSFAPASLDPSRLAGNSETERPSRTAPPASDTPATLAYARALLNRRIERVNATCTRSATRPGHPGASFRRPRQRPGSTGLPSTGTWPATSCCICCPVTSTRGNRSARTRCRAARVAHAGSPHTQAPRPGTRRRRSTTTPSGATARRSSSSGGRTRRQPMQVRSDPACFVERPPRDTICAAFEGRASPEAARPSPARRPARRAVGPLRSGTARRRT